MVDITQLKAANATRWASMTVKSALIPSLDRVVTRLLGGKVRYQGISARTNVPWAVIAVIHEREASGNWNDSLAQGDPWDAVSTHDPIGRGPFASFEDAAYDALMNCAPNAGRWTDWSIGGALTILEEYNGLGYANGPAPTKGPNAGRKFPPQPSPYVWSSTDQYVSGKFVADHDFRPEVVDQQEGCAALLSRMFVADPSADFTAPAPLVAANPAGSGTG
jgi:lysozyme family protein